MSKPPIDPNPIFNPHAAVAGWVVPGLGHFILGQRKRGIILGVAILSLWLMGLFIGGISVIDRNDRTENTSARSWWYYGQALIAPSIAVEMYRNNLEQSDADAYEPSFGRMAEQGTLYTALAGMLNLLAIIDVLYCDPAYRRNRDLPKSSKPVDLSAEAQA